MRAINRKGWAAIAALVVVVIGGVWIQHSAAARRDAELDAASIAIASDPAQAAATSRWESENRKGP